MKLSSEFHPQAERELAEAVTFYDQKSANLGDAFASAVEVAIGFGRANPAAGTPLPRGVRRWLLRRFPYSRIYREETDRVYILALAHHKRMPGYWEHRL